MQELQVQSLGWKDPTGKKMTAHSSILAGIIPWTEEPGGLQSMGSPRVGHDWAAKHKIQTDFDTLCIQGPVMATQTLLRCPFRSELPLCLTAGTELLLCLTAKLSFQCRAASQIKQCWCNCWSWAGHVLEQSWETDQPLVPFSVHFLLPASGVSMCMHISHKQSPGFS